MANQNKDFGITHIKCLWKAKKVTTVASYLPKARVFDISIVKRPVENNELVKFLLVYHNESKGPLMFTMINLA